MFGETEDGEQVQFWPIRPTAARSMRPGDEMLVPDQNGPWPQVAMHGRITDIRCDEATGLITINGELVRGADGLFEKPAYPAEAIQRLLQPWGPTPGTESVIVPAPELWKWIGVDIDDPDGTAEKYALRTFKRVHDDEINAEVIELRLQSKWNPQKFNTTTMLTTGSITFIGHR